MADQAPFRVAIVDYGLGNLYSVRQACAQAGMLGQVTSARQDLAAAAAVILPGVGAYGDAMAALHRLDLVAPLQDLAGSGKLLLGICLGMQLLMSESHEFGRHKGLGIIDGPVVRFPDPEEAGRKLKIPQVGWNRLYPGPGGRPWQETPLAGLPAGEYLYFVHSFIAQPREPAVVLAVTRYGNVEFCSCLQRGNVFACQCHPERSGAQGLRIYRNLMLSLRNAGKGES